jgi:serine/threonine protein kinase
LERKLCSNVYEARSPRFDSTIVVKLRDSLGRYCTLARRRLRTTGFKGMCEDGRVISFLMERITDARHPTLEGLSVCQQTLSKLHRLGIKHGDMNKHNLVIRDRRAILIDFDNSERCRDGKAVERGYRPWKKRYETLLGGVGV